MKVELPGYVLDAIAKADGQAEVLNRKVSVVMSGTDGNFANALSLYRTIESRNRQRRISEYIRGEFGLPPKDQFARRQIKALKRGRKLIGGA